MVSRIVYYIYPKSNKFNINSKKFSFYDSSYYKNSLFIDDNTNNIPEDNNYNNFDLNNIPNTEDGVWEYFN